MGRQLTADELKRFGRVLAGHSQDKDRARWKRKLKGQKAAPARSKKQVPEDDGQELGEQAAEDESEP